MKHLKRIGLALLGCFLGSIAVAIWQCGLTWVEWCGKYCDCLQVAINNFIVVWQFIGKLLLSGCFLIPIFIIATYVAENDK